MGIIISPESALGQEMAKWEKPYQFRRFPAMLYKAQKKANGKIVCVDGQPSPHAGWTSSAQYDQACLAVDSFNKQNQRIVQNEDEERTAKNQGWKDTPQDAVAAFEAMELELSRAAAEANYAAQRMTEKARTELLTADRATAEHIGDLPAPKKKPGRPKRVVPPEVPHEN